jgi:hypothetical protein
MRSTATVKVCVGVDLYQNQIYQNFTVNRVHIQPEERMVKSSDNTDQQLTGTLYVDARRSTPALDWRAMLANAHSLGGDMRVIIRGVEYTVLTAEGLRDGNDRLHHWEIGVK